MTNEHFRFLNRLLSRCTLLSDVRYHVSRVTFAR